MELLNTLKNISIFKDMNTEEIKQIILKLNYKIKKYKKDETIYFRGDKINYALINLSGELYSEMQKYNGDVIEVGIIKTHELFSFVFIFGDSNTTPVDVVARTDCEILSLEKEKLLECMQENKKFLNNFLDEISNKSQFLSKRLWFNFVNKSIEDKIIDYIEQNSKDDIIHFRPSISEISRRFGVTRPSLSREISNLCSRGVLQRIGKNKYNINRREFEKL